jgi:hypothetical protein
LCNPSGVSLNKPLVIILAVSGTVSFLNAIYPSLRSALVNAGSRPPAARKPAPYTADDRARDTRRAEFLQREARKNPVLDRLVQEQRARRAAGLD